MATLGTLMNPGCFVVRLKFPTCSDCGLHASASSAASGAEPINLGLTVVSSLYHTKSVSWPPWKKSHWVKMSHFTMFFSWQLSQPAMTVMTGSIMSLLAWSESHFTKKRKSAVIWCKVAKPCKTLAAVGDEFEQVFGKLSAFDDGAASFNYIDIRCTVSIFLLVLTACLACVHVYGCF